MNRLFYIVLALFFLYGPTYSQDLINFGWTGGYAFTTRVNCFAKDVSRNIYAGTGKGLYKTTDHGQTWKLIAFLGSNIRDIVFDSNNTILANVGGYYLSTWRSVDTGKTWANLNLAFISLAADRFGNIYGGSANGDLYQSIDRGLTWNFVHAFGRDISIGQVSVDTGGTIYVTHHYDNLGIKISSDQGKTWINHEPAIGGHPACLYFASPERCLFGTANSPGRVFLSTDKTKSWKTILTINHDAFLGFLADSLCQEILVVSDSGLRHSWDGGKTWALDSVLRWRVYFGQFHGYPCIIQDTGNLIHVGTNELGIYDSYDFGRTWQQHLSGASPMRASCLAYRNVDTTLFMGTTDGIYYSNGTWAAWQKLSDSLDKINISSIISFDDSVIIATSGNKIIYSHSKGLKWSTSSIVSASDFHLFKNEFSGRAYVLSDGSLFNSVDKGITWEKVNTSNGDSLTTVWIDSVMYYATVDRHIKKSIDGVTWTILGDQIPEKIEVISKNNWGLFVGTQEGMYHFEDSLSLWKRLTDWPTNLGVKFLESNSKNELIAFSFSGEISSSYNNTAWKHHPHKHLPFVDFRVFDDRLFGLGEATQLSTGNAKLGLKVNKVENRVDVYPSPCFQNYFYLTTQLVKSPSVRLTNVHGLEYPVILDFANTPNTWKVNLIENLPQGIYFISVSDGKEHIGTSKLLIVR